MPDEADFLHRIDAGWAALPPGATYGPRRVNHYQFLYIEAGDAVAELDGRSYDAPAGTMILLHPGMTDYYRWDPVRHTKASYIHWQMRAPLAELPPREAWPRAVRLPESDIVRPLFRHLGWLMDRKGPHQAALLQSALRHLLVAFVSGELHTRAESSGDLPEPVARALRHVQARWNEGSVSAFTLAQLARAAHVSSGHLCRVFKQTLGCGPLQALRLIRVDRAATLLARTNLPVREIARQTGFENAFHFSRCFREAFRMPPREYRLKAVAGQIVPSTRLMNVRRIMGPAWA